MTEIDVQKHNIHYQLRNEFVTTHSLTQHNITVVSESHPEIFYPIDELIEGTITTTYMISLD